MQYKMVRVDEDTHKKLKVIASINGLSIREYIQKIVKQIEKEELKALNTFK